MLEYFANIAEIVGLALVVVTLLFLTLQIRQNTRAIRSTTIQAVMQSEMAFSNILVDNAATWDKVLTAAPLESGEETRKGIVLFNVFMIDTEVRYHQFLSGYLDVQSWNGRLGTLRDVVKLPIYPVWRKSLGGQSHAADFLQLLYEQFEGQEDDNNEPA